MHSLEIWCDIMSGYSSGFLSCETLTLAITSTAPKSIPEGLIQLFSPGVGPLPLPSRTPAAAWLVILPLSFHVMVCLPRWRVWEAKPQADTSIQSARTHFVVPLADFVLSVFFSSPFELPVDAWSVCMSGMFSSHSVILLPAPIFKFSSSFCWWAQHCSVQ